MGSDGRLEAYNNHSVNFNQEPKCDISVWIDRSGGLRAHFYPPPSPDHPVTCRREPNPQAGLAVWIWPLLHYISVEQAVLCV